MTQVPPNVLSLYFRLCRLIRARKWKEAYAVSDSLKLLSKDYR